MSRSRRPSLPSSQTGHGQRESPRQVAPKRPTEDRGISGQLLSGFCRLVDHAPIMVWVMDHLGNTVFLNRLFLEFTGLAANVSPIPSWDVSVHDEDAPALRRTFSVAAAAGLPLAFECRLRRHDGIWRHVQVHARPFPGESGQTTGYLGFCFDVHERFETREALVQSDARFRSLVEQIPAVLYMAPVENVARLEFVSPQVEQLLGYTAADFLHQPDLWRSCIHPDDLDRIEFRPKLTGMANRAFVAEYRMVSRDGTVRWIHDEAVMVHRPDGRPVCYQGIMLDVTERRQLEETLRIYAEAIEGLDDLVAAIDRRQRFIMVNRSWLEYQGKTREEVMGKHL
ncbi:MAG TPA: PAS domain S-box protein, partial [Candidatus Ozemobacteraceae bacterium]|nr:PAS domain S-box protein [Candidatus Ozemobacteraceae bacterium]